MTKAKQTDPWEGKRNGSETLVLHALEFSQSQQRSCTRGRLPGLANDLSTYCPRITVLLEFQMHVFGWVLDTDA